MAVAAGCRADDVVLSSAAVNDQVEEQVSWMETPAHAPVISSDGTEVGRVVEVAALRDEDIFHGIVFRRAKHHEDVLAPASDIARISTKAVHLSVDAAGADGYEPFHQMHIERLGLRGVFSWKHFSWKDSGE